MSAADAPVPDDIEGLRRQNGAYRALCRSLEDQMAILTQKGREYHEAITTLESERAANAILTGELEELSAAMAGAAIIAIDRGSVVKITFAEGHHGGKLVALLRRTTHPKEGQP